MSHGIMACIRYEQECNPVSLLSLKNEFLDKYGDIPFEIILPEPIYTKNKE